MNQKKAARGCRAAMLQEGERRGTVYSEILIRPYSTWPRGS